MARLLRLSLFQVSVGMAVVLLNGTLNRVMVIELGQAAWLVSLMVSLPLLFAPLRALIGFRSDHHRSVLGWRAGALYLVWHPDSVRRAGHHAVCPDRAVGSDCRRAGLAGPGRVGAGFPAGGAGLHTSQTAGLALATDLASKASRPRVVALLYVMLLVGMVISSLGFACCWMTFHQVRLIRVIQGAALLTMVLNIIALWKQESTQPGADRTGAGPPGVSRMLA